MALKHVGRMRQNKRKVVVAYRTVPNEPNSAVVVTTENLMAEEHDTLMKLVESPAGQNAEELADAMARTPLPDGRIMLSAFHTTGKMVKVNTSDVEMTPDTQTVIMLDELNNLIAEQKGVSVGDLAVKPSQKQAAQAKTNEEVIVNDPVEQVTVTTEDVISDEQLAAQYRSQADSLFKEAKRLREQAEELVPTKRKAKSKTTAGAQ